MKQLNLAILLINVCFVGYPQHSGITRIYDAQSKQPLSYACIRSSNNKTGTYSDSSGTFLLMNAMDDSIMVSRIGYTSRKLAVKDIFESSIYLQPAENLLEPVTVSKRRLLGVMNVGTDNYDINFSWTSTGRGEEFAQLIKFPHPKKTYKIKKITIAAERFDATIPMVLHVYSREVNGKPGDNILLNQIILTKKEHYKRRHRQFVIDVSKENIIVLDGSCFIGVEWLRVSDTPKHLPTTVLLLTNLNPDPLTYSRWMFGNGATWSLAPTYREQIHPTNMLVTAEVEEYE